MKTGWVTKRLGEVCEGKIARLKTLAVDTIKYIDISSIDRLAKKVVSSTEYEVKNAPGRAQQVVLPDDLLVSTVRPNLNAVALVPYDVDGALIASTGFSVLRAGDMVCARWLYYFSQTSDFIDPLVADSEKAAYPSVTDARVREVEIPVPPLVEQKRIVAKIDAAFEKIDKLKANAERNLANAKELFQSALNEAMRPKPGWVEKRLGEIGPVCMCKRVLKSDTNPDFGVPFYKIGTFGKKANAFISNELYRKFRSLYKFPNKGDVLISAAGTIGRTVVYDGEPAYFQDSNIVWIANDETEVLNSYLLLSYATSPWSVTKGATIPRLYNENIEQALIAFPCVNEQRVIVREFADLKSNIEILQSNYTRLIADCAEMRQAVLREAFEGRL